VILTFSTIELMRRHRHIRETWSSWSSRGFGGQKTVFDDQNLVLQWECKIRSSAHAVGQKENDISIAIGNQINIIQSKGKSTTVSF
jgi:hypothetical protein